MMGCYCVPTEVIDSGNADHTNNITDSNNINNNTNNNNNNDSSSKHVAIERNFIIHASTFKETPLVHRPYTNQYKWLVKDFCVHFIKDDNNNNIHNNADNNIINNNINNDKNSSNNGDDSCTR